MRVKKKFKKKKKWTLDYKRKNWTLDYKTEKNWTLDGNRTSNLVIKIRGPYQLHHLEKKKMNNWRQNYQQLIIHRVGPEPFWIVRICDQARYNDNDTVSVQYLIYSDVATELTSTQKAGV